MDRAATIAESIAESRSKSAEFVAGTEFIITHLLSSADAPCEHRLSMLGRLHSYRRLTREHGQGQGQGQGGQGKTLVGVSLSGKSDRASSLLDTDLLSDRGGSLLGIAVETVREALSCAAGGDLSVLDWQHISDISTLLTCHMQAQLSGLTGQPLAAPDAVLSLRALARRAGDILTALHPFTSSFVTGVTLQDAPPHFRQAHGVTSCVLIAMLCLAEVWCLDGEESFCALSDRMESALALAGLCAADPQQTTLAECTSLTAHSVLSLLGSVRVLHAIERGALRESISCGSAVGSYWRDAVASQMTSTRGPDRTIMLATAVADTRRVMTAIAQDHAQLGNGLCLVVCACLGAVVEFRGASMGGLTSLEALCASRHACTLLEAVPALIRPVMRELAPLARIRLLLGMGQHGSALEEGSAAGYFRRTGEGEEVTVCVDMMRGLTFPVTQWIYVSLLRELRLYVEATTAADFFLSSSLQCNSAWLTVEKSWAVLESAVCDRRHKDLSSAHTGEVLSSFGLLRDMSLPGDVCDMVISALSGVLTGVDTSKHEIEATIRFRMGVAMWLEGGSLRTEKSKCIATLLGAAKADPTLGCIYSYIGHFYHLVMKDSARAAKCYLKALAADPMDAEAGVALSQLYIDSGDIPQLLKLWSDVKELTACHSWWCFSLEGQYYLTLQDYNTAVDSFQKSLELNEQDATMWFGMGLCYFYLRQDAAALKSLLRAHDIISRSGGSVVCVLCVQAEVERRLGLLHDAEAHFDAVCGSAQADAVTRKGLAEVCLALAFERYTMGWTHGAALSIDKGLRVLDDILAVMGEESSVGISSAHQHIRIGLLKLRGDLCSFSRHLGPGDAQRVGTCPGGGDEESYWSYGCILELLQQAEESYRRVGALVEAELLKGQSAATAQVPGGSYTVTRADLESAWYDIGCAAYYQAVVLGTAMGQGAGVCETNVLLGQLPTSSSPRAASPFDKLQVALEAFLRGIRAGDTPTHSGCWNGIGLCIRQNDALRELCFVMAARIDASPTAFANISLLLILHGLDSEAKECLSALQLMEANPLHWVSLGILMERELSTAAGEDCQLDVLAAVPAYDAYCAALEVAKPADAWLGMAISWMRVKRLLTADGRLTESFATIQKQGVTNIDVKYFVEVPVALFLHRRSVHPYAWILLGWALGFRNQLDAAIEAYCNGVQALDVSAKYVLAAGLGDCTSSRSAAYSVGMVKSFHRMIVVGMARCIATARGSSVAYDSLVRRSESALLPPCIAHVIRLVGSAAEATSLLDGPSFAGSVDAQVVSLCEAGKYNDVAEVMWSEMSRLVAASDIVETVRLINLSCALLQPHLDKAASSALVHFCVRLCDRMVDDIQDLQDADDSTKTLVQVAKTSVHTVCRLVQIILSLSLTPSAQSIDKLRFLLETASSYHPENDEVLRLLSVCCSEDSKSQLLLQSLAMAGASLTATFDLEERFDIDQSLLCHVACGGNGKSKCRCSLIKLKDGHDTVRSYCAAVNMSTRDNISNGKRCGVESKRHLLRSLMLDPSNVDSWSTVAAQIFSDNVLGAPPAPGATVSNLPALNDTPRSAEMSTGSRDDDASSMDEVKSDCSSTAGCFYGEPYLSLCMTILSYTSQFDSRVSADGRVQHAAQELLQASIDIAVDAPVADSSDSVCRARKLFAERKYRDCIALYRSGIKEVEMSAQNDSQLLGMASQLWNEMGHALSCSLQPEGAEYCYGIACARIRSALPSSEGKEGDLADGYSRVMAAIGYLRRYQAKKNIEDANKAKAIAEECSASFSVLSIQAASSVVTGAVWMSQGKAKKCAAELERAKAVWSPIEIPNCVYGENK